MLVGLAKNGTDPAGLIEAKEQREAEAEAAAVAEAAALVKKKAAALLCFGEFLLDAFLEDRAADVRPNTLIGWRVLARSEVAPYTVKAGTLDETVKVWRTDKGFGSRDPVEITREQLEDWHLTFKTDRPIYGNRSLELIKGVYAWAIKKRKLKATPVVGIDSHPERPRDRVLNHDEIRRVMLATAHEFYGDAFTMLWLTLTRKGETLGMEWAEIDFSAKTWTIPATRAKTGKAHLLPLLSPALVLCRGVERRTPRGPSYSPVPSPHAVTSEASRHPCGGFKSGRA